MTVFQIVAFGLMIVASLFACSRGGPPEWRGATTILIWILCDLVSPDWLTDDVFGTNLFGMSVEIVVLAVFLHMALKGDRWWPFATVALMTLSVMVYLVPLFVPEFDRRARISAHVGIGYFLCLSILAGVGERWLAGEAGLFAAQSKLSRQV